MRDAFAARGWEAMSCDLLPSDAGGNHYTGDVRDVLYGDWDLIIAHPPCTYLANSGVKHLKTDITRWEKLFDAAAFFNLFRDVDCDHVAIENPIMHGYAKQLICVEPAQIIQPYHFGHLESKQTCLWLKGLPPLRKSLDLKGITDLLPDNIVQRLHYLPPSPDRWKLRSTTYSRIAEAMAQQWSEALL